MTATTIRSRPLNTDPAQMVGSANTQKEHGHA